MQSTTKAPKFSPNKNKSDRLFCEEARPAFECQPFHNQKIIMDPGIHFRVI
jgi:hypothetical protein